MAKTLEGQQDHGGCGWAQNRKHFCTAVSKSDSLRSGVCTDEYWGSPSLWKFRPHVLALVLGVWLWAWRVHLLKQWRKHINCASSSLLVVLLPKKTLHIPANIMSVENSLLDRNSYLSPKNVYLIYGVWYQVISLFFSVTGRVHWIVDTSVSTVSKKV